MKIGSHKKSDSHWQFYDEKSFDDVPVKFKLFWPVLFNQSKRNHQMIRDNKFGIQSLAAT